MYRDELKIIKKKHWNKAHCIGLNVHRDRHAYDQTLEIELIRLDRA